MLKFIWGIVSWVFGLFAKWKAFIANKAKQRRIGYKKAQEGMKKKDPTKTTMGIDRINNA